MTAATPDADVDPKREAELEAWLHSEMGLSYMEIAQYTPTEIRRLEVGWDRIQEKEQRRAQSGSLSSTDPARESKLRREREAMAEINEKYTL